MVEWVIGGTVFRLSILFPALVIVLLSCDPTHTVLLCLLASFLHEIGHALAMLIVHDQPRRVTMGIFGVTIERDRTRFPGYAASVAVSLAGPLINGICFLILWVCGCREAGVIHAALGIVNLLPIVSLDGGEAVYAALCLRCSEQTALRILRVVSALFVLPLTFLGAFLAFTDTHNVTLLLLSGYLILLLFLKERH